MRIGFQTRVLGVVVGVLVGVGAISVAVVNARIQGEVSRDQTARLQTADAVFRHSEQSRSLNLLLRYGAVPDEPRFKAVTRLGEPKTIRFTLEERRQELGCGAILFQSASGVVVAADAALPSEAALSGLVASGLRAAGEGRSAFSLAAVEGRLFDVACVPVLVGGQVEGALAFVDEVTEAALRELSGLTDCDVAYYDKSRLLVASSRVPAQVPSLLDQVGSSKGSAAAIRVMGGQYLARMGVPEGVPPGNGLRYVILASLEKPMGALRETQRLLTLTSLLGLVLGGAVVWIFIRSATHPLRALSANAEAVGRGDFSRRSQIKSRDEFGLLGNAFNRMTENLEASRRDLEQAVVQLKRTQEQLVQREKLSALGEFVAGVTHELNNPLTAIVGYAELLQGATLPPEQRHDLDALASGARRCQKIVRSLLGFARQQKPERTRADVNALIEDVLAFMEYELRKGRVRVERAFAPDLPPCHVDPHQIQQVILNIISNARQAMEGRAEEGVVEIRTECVADRVRVCIRDNGPGITAENLPRIFDPFFTTKPDGRGTGLGLSLSYGIVQEHGGTIAAESVVGEGTVFTIELPAMPVPGQTPAALRPQRLLVIDDEAAVCDLIARLPGMKDHQVTAVSDGEEAWRILQDQPFDVIVCDVNMPLLSGLALYERILAQLPRYASRMLFMTGAVVSEDAQRLMKEHRRVVLTKPFSSDEFRKALTLLAGAAT